MEVEVTGGGKGELGFFPYWVAAPRNLEPHSPFFAAGNIERELLAKQVALDLTEDEKYQLQNMEDADGHAVCCPIVGCGAQLVSLEEFEDHYNSRHTASCSICTRVFPTSHLLSLHVSEAHDSYFQAKVARGIPMYECLVEGCGVKLKSYQSRQQHLVDKHKFPTSFEFFKKTRPSKQQRQKYQRKQTGYPREDTLGMMKTGVEGKISDEQYQKCQHKQTGQTKEERKETDMEVEEEIHDLVSGVSKLSTSDSTPTAISFGHRHAQGFSFVPRSVQRNKKHNSPADEKQ